ncbi:hypothetical protein [Anatilimnocola floriformis]|uniref:hypothetical protein n=1 Tax=Anatilimnocola floriformis TaxID=2948575 RepID=UPI0020C2190F|nr:hypothetical protein [Anatilimnocola floriformis]
MLRLAFLFALLPAIALAQEQRQQVVVVVGATGSEEFEKPFQTWADRWEAAAKKGNAGFTKIAAAKDGIEPKTQLQTWFKQHADSQQPIWLVLIGHGTFDGKVARFNLQGPDVSSAELKEMLQPIEGQLAVINCTSSSGPFLAEIAAPQRVVITAAQSGHEYNFAHLGEYLSAAIADPVGDLDKDEQTSLLEAYLLASSRLREFYKKDGRLATEHALLDDNGDKQGTPADWFQGLRVVKRSKAGAAADGELARQFVLVRSEREAKLPAAFVEQRAALERQLSELRQRKEMLSEADYLAELEPLLVKIARLGEEKSTPAEKPAASR